MSGNLSLVKSGEFTKITGVLEADTATVAGLLRPWTEPPARRGTALADATAVLNAATPAGAWPQAVIDLIGARSEGTLQLRTRRLDVTQGLALHASGIHAPTPAPGRADVVDLVGRAGNGNWTGSFALEPAAPASKLTGIIRGKGVRFDQLLASGTTRPPATGSFDVMLTASGRGHTFRDMVSDLAGSDARVDRGINQRIVTDRRPRRPRNGDDRTG